MQEHQLIEFDEKAIKIPEERYILPEKDSKSLMNLG